MKKNFSICLILLIAASGIAQTGGGFNLEQNVMGNGGWRSEGGAFTVLGTMGQSNAGSTASGGPFHLIDGLWAMENPTANSPFVSLTGRVFRHHGVGIPRVLIMLTNQTTNQSYQVWTGAHGEYQLTDLPRGANYVIAVSHRRFKFEPHTVSLFLSQDLSDVNFVSIQ